jgi:hypothetical protein
MRPPWRSIEGISMGSQSNRHTPRVQELLQIGHRMLRIVKDGGGEGRVRLALGEDVGEMVKGASAP